MRFIRIVGLAVLAAVAVGMIASASASATLGVFECEAKSGGTLGGNCLTGGTGFTEKEIAGAKFTSVGGKTILTAGTGITVECKETASEGIITSRTEDYGTLKFSKCEAATKKCHNTSAAESEGILLIPVSSKIVSYFGTGGVLLAGLLLAPRTASGANETEFRCGNTSTGTTIKVRGSVVGALSPEDTMKISATVKFTVTGGKQVITEKENGLEAKEGNSKSYEAATQSGEALLDFQLSVEVMG